MMSDKIKDDWMEPRTSISWESPPPKNGTFYQIQRKRRIPVTGNVAFLERWDVYAEYESKDERDKKLARLRETTEWHLRARTVNYINGRDFSRDPSEYQDF